MTQEQSSSAQKRDIDKFLKRYGIKGTRQQLKSDFFTGILNGIEFGAIFSYYFTPIELYTEPGMTKYRGSKLLYTLVNCAKFGFFFGAIRAIFNQIDKHQLSFQKQLAIRGLTIAVSAYYI